MPLIFSSGTLQQEDVHLKTFGRLLDGQNDELPGYEPSLVKIEEQAVAAALGKAHHANVEFNGNKASRVAGTVFQITDAELASSDGYEAVSSYKRVDARLASGKRAWVYVYSYPAREPRHS